jgi:hypothetical protein
MKNISRRIILIGILFIAFSVVVAAAKKPVIASEDIQSQRLYNLGVSDLESEVASTLSEIPLGSFPPQAVQDPCLHCHIKGEEKGIWTPLTRWLVFGTAGVVIIFGFVRTTITLKTRKTWTPIKNLIADWLEDRYQYKEPLSKVLSKPVPEWQRRWWYCLGGLTAFFFFVQGVTGIMLAFYYKPTPETAYASIQFIESEVYFGAVVRMIHHWSSNGMVLMCFAHMLRVFIMGAYKKPRELNWVSGVTLFVVTLAFGFTGYLLPWDQRAFWATTVGSEIAGGLPVIGNLALLFLRVGWDISALTLNRFYSLHILILPLITVGVMLAHFVMVRRQGIMKPL